jgi:hypothetical protein
MTSPQPGARPGDWQYLADLGLTGDLLPVVSDTSAPISPRSKIKDVGKTPSTFNRDGDVVGLKDWTQQRSTWAQVTQWAINPRLGICLQMKKGCEPDESGKEAIRQELQVLLEERSSNILPFRIFFSQ